MATATGSGMAEASRSSGSPKRIDTAKVRTRSELDNALKRGSDMDEMEKLEKLLDYNSTGEEPEQPSEAMSTDSLDKETADDKVFDSTEDDGEEEEEEEEDEDGSETSSFQSMLNVSGTSSSSAAASGQYKYNNRLGSDYRTVRAARNSASCERQLNPSPKSTDKAHTATFGTEDERNTHCTMDFDIRARTNKCLSFDPKSKKCTTCTPPGHCALKTRFDGPVVLVGSDQCFPACLPAGDGEECIRVVRVEDGSLQEVTHALADAIGSTALHQGTIFLLGSITYLGTVGTQQYLTDWVRSRWWLKNRFGEGCRVLPLVPIAVQGIGGMSTVRSVLESLHWFLSLRDTEAILMKKHIEYFCDTYLHEGKGTSETDWANGRQSFRVPAGLDTKASVSLVSEGWGSRPDCIPPLSLAAERKLVLSLVNELNSAFETSLSTELCLERSSADMCNARRHKGLQKLIAVVGGSHAARLSEQLRAKEAQICELTQPGWRAGKLTVNNAATELMSLSPPPNVVVLQCLDNSSFFSLNEDGSLTLPTKSLLDGRYHLMGELKIATKEQVANLLRMLLPIMKAVPSAEIILVACTPRYMYSKCCPVHCDLSPPEIAKLLADLSGYKKNLRSLLFQEKMGNVRIVDPLAVCSLDQVGSYADHVHLVSSEYEKLATAVLDCVAGPPSHITGSGGPPAAKRPRMMSGPPGPGYGSGNKRGRGAGWAGGFRGGRGGGRGRWHGRRGSW